MTGPSRVAPPFTQQLWSGIEDVYAKVLSHPFITGLRDGTLPRDSFCHYIVQDSHYLREYARVLAVCASRADEVEYTAMFARHAADSVSAELDLHAELLGELGLTRQQAAARPIGPTTQAYVNFLLAAAHTGSFAEALGAVLPCYWLGARVGETLRAGRSPDPLYDRWINAYAEETFQGVVEGVLTATDRTGARISEHERLLVHARVRTAARYEWMFWDAAYRRESWPL
jgi:thiaminase/transcriptional activator TenA